MEIAYKVFRVEANGVLAPCVVKQETPEFYVEYQKKAINVPKIGKFFVFKSKPQWNQIARIIGKKHGVKVYRCLVDTLIEARYVPSPPMGAYHTSAARHFWENLSQFKSSNTQPIPDTHFCNEFWILEDVTNTIKGQLI